MFSKPISTGTFCANGAVRKCSSTALNPARNCRNWSVPMPMASEMPIAESTEYRPATQSQNPKAFWGSMPKVATLARAVETATKWRETASLGLVGVLDRAGCDQAVPEPRPRQPRVDQGLQRAEGLGRDDEQGGRRVEVRDGLRDVGRVDVGHEPDSQPVGDVGLERLVGHHRAEVRAADADVDHRRHRLAGDAQIG